ncbi:hypothetical protein MSSD1_456 [Mycoplasmopsis synoviae]
MFPYFLNIDSAPPNKIALTAIIAEKTKRPTNIWIK